MHDNNQSVTAVADSNNGIRAEIGETVTASFAYFDFPIASENI
jgi:hypothetical protein